MVFTMFLLVYTCTRMLCNGKCFLLCFLNIFILQVISLDPVRTGVKRFIEITNLLSKYHLKQSIKSDKILLETMHKIKLVFHFLFGNFFFGKNLFL